MEAVHGNINEKCALCNSLLPGILKNANKVIHNNGCCLYFLKDFHKMRGGSNFHHKKGDVCKIGGDYFKRDDITLY